MRSRSVIATFLTTPIRNEITGLAGFDVADFIFDLFERAE